MWFPQLFSRCGEALDVYGNCSRSQLVSQTLVSVPQLKAFGFMKQFWIIKLRISGTLRTSKPRDRVQSERIYSQALWCGLIQ